MARARNIKPGFFTNELLVEMDYATRLLFVGLWTIADRAGRLEDRPKKIKMQLFAADDLDIDAALTALAGAGFLVRYGTGEQRYIQVVNFDIHQRPHTNETQSIIPAPPGLATMAESAANHGEQDGEPSEQALRSRSFNSNSNLTPPYSPPPPGGSGADAPKTALAKPRQPIPADFEPSADDRAWATSRGLDGAEVERETEKFVVNYRANGKVMKDWRAAWRNWMLKVPDFRRAPPNGRADITGELDTAKYTGGKHLRVKGG